MSSGLDYATRAEFERRFQRLELTLFGKADANPLTGDTNAPGEVTTSVPTPSGLAVVPNLGTVTVRWSPVTSKNLRVYQVQFATLLDFTNAVTISTRETEYTWPDGDPTENYYVRVRATTQDGGTSEWSAPLETSTGKAGYADLSATAATNPIRTVDNRETSGAGSGTDLFDTDIGYFAETTIETKGGIVLADVSIQASILGQTSDTLQIDLLRDDVVVDSSGVVELLSDVGALRRTALPAIGMPATAPTGTYVYKLKVQVWDTGVGIVNIQLRVHKVTMVLTELRQGIT